jgi:hypothetical protein
MSVDHICSDPHNGDQVRLYLHYGDIGNSGNRARKRFGFESQTSFDEGLRRTIAWYLTVTQIDGQLSLIHKQDLDTRIWQLRETAKEDHHADRFRT